MAKFELLYPARPVGINQPFGVNKSTYSQFGLEGHNGIDFMAGHGLPVYAAHDGTAYYEVDDSQGHGVVLISKDEYTYKGQTVHFKTIYWHLCDAKKEPKFASPIYKAGVNSGKGVALKAGDLIGYADSTGFSTGDHLHFGLKPIIPGQAPTRGDAPDVGIGNWVNVEQNNGFLGSIDPMPYFKPEPTAPNTSVDYTQALKNLSAGGLTGALFQAAMNILKKVYKK